MRTALKALFYKVQVLLEHISGLVKNCNGRIQIDELVESVFDIVANVCLGVFKVDFFDVLVGLSDFDACADLALGVKDLGGGEAHAGLPAVTLGFHAVNEAVHGGGQCVCGEGLVCIGTHSGCSLA